MSPATETEHAPSHAEPAIEHAIEHAPAPDPDAEHDPEVSRRASLAGLRREAAAQGTGDAAVQQKRASGAVQQKGGAVQQKGAAVQQKGQAAGDVHAAAARGIAAPATALPHRERIQAAFGPAHDVSRVQAHIGPDACHDMGATAYASGDHVVFDREPDLHTAAHEAAHVVQQAQGVHLYGGVGEAGDAYEQQADAVADRVVAGESAADLLGAPTSGASSAADAVQRKGQQDEVTAKAADDPHEAAQDASFDGIQAALILGARRLDSQVDEIDRLISNPGQGGPVRSMDVMVHIFSTARWDMVRLRCQVGSLSDRVMRKHLHPEVSRLGGAWSRFAMAWARAQSFASKHQVDLGKNPYALKDQIDQMFEMIGLDKKTAYDGSMDERSSTEILKNAVTASLSAVTARERSLRVALATGRDEIAKQDLTAMSWHLKEVAVSLGQDFEGKASAAVSAQAGKVVKAVRALKAELSTKPELVQVAPELTQTLDEIMTLTGTR